MSRKFTLKLLIIWTMDVFIFQSRHVSNEIRASNILRETKNTNLVIRGEETKNVKSLRI